LRYSIQKRVQAFVVRNHIVSQKKSQKFSESAWKLLVYSTLWIWGACLTLPESYFWNPSEFTTNWPNIPIPLAVRIFYLTELSFYIHGFVTHITIEVRRKDFIQMLFHHIISAGLIVVSYQFSLWKFGTVLLLLHDINDVFLESGKLFVYSGYQKLADIAFGCLIVCWFITRIILYPIKIINSSFMYGYKLAEMGDLFHVYYFINFLLFALQGLNIMWFSMMIRLLCNVILKKGKITDSREDEEDEHRVKKSISKELEMNASSLQAE